MKFYGYWLRNVLLSRVLLVRQSKTTNRIFDFIEKFDFVERFENFVFPCKAKSKLRPLGNSLSN